jgi:acid stress chaperone HdeB
MGIRIIYWLDGYYRDDVEPAVIDTDKHKKMIVELADHCTKNETHGVITAADTPFQKKK